MKRYKFQALVTLGQPAKDESAPVPAGQTRRMVLRAQHHQTHASQFFTALVTGNGENPSWLGDDHVIMTVALAGDDTSEYFDIGDHFALWLGSDIGSGVVTRRLFI